MSDKDKLAYYVTLSYAFRDSLAPDGMRHLQDGLALSKRLKQRESEGEILANLAFRYMLLYDYENSLNCVVEALKIGTEYNSPKILGSGYNDLGLYYYYRGSYDKSYDYFLRSLRFRSKSGTKKELAATLNNTGLVFLQIKNYASALDYFERSLTLKNELEDKRSVVRTICNIALCYKSTAEYEKAYRIIDSGLKICEISNNSGGRSLLYNIWGDILLLQGKPKEALAKYKATLANYNYLRFKKGTGAVDICLSLSRYYKAVNNSALAAKYLDTALFIAKESKLNGMLPRIYNELSENYELLQNFKLASGYRKLYSDSKDSLYNLEKNRVITEMQILYSVEEQEKELQAKKTELYFFYFIGAFFTLVIIALFWMLNQKKKNHAKLLAKNAEILEQQALLSRTNAALTASEMITKQYAEELKEIIATKDKFFSILAHDLKAPYNIILGIAEIIAEESGKMAPEDIKSLSQQLYETAVVQYRLLENLLEWGRFQRDKIIFNPEWFSPTESVEIVIQILSGLADKKGVVIRSSISQSLKLYADRNMFETMVRNLLSNAIKFSSRNQLIEINAEKQNGSTVFEFIDNGVGIPAEQIDALFKIEQTVSTPGTDKEKGTGLGLILCKELIDKHKGSIEVDSKLQVGTKVKVAFPDTTS
ncbi:MAG: tetratricopeptide repeat protein [Ignavibacteriales bacterium]|nr:tetratricopeptide repeat protein [Ignavibacteriales bacterium]